VTLLLIGVGGGVGALLRYGLSVWLGRGGEGFPVATLVVNVSGCVLIGLLVPLLKGWNVRESVQLGLLVGLLGGYTTFSSFGRETFGLVESGRVGMAVGYVGLSNVLGVVGVWVGMVIGRGWA